MKRFLFILLCLNALSTAERVQAQSLDDLMKGLGAMFSSEQPANEQPREVYPSLDELLGRLKYDALAIKYKGDSTLASLAVSTLESQLPMIGEKLGLVAGRDYMDVGEDGSLHIVCDGKQAAAYCSSYDSTTGRTSMMMRVGEQSIYIGATVTKVANRFALMFDARELFALMAKHDAKFAENTTLQMIKSVVDNYPGISVGLYLRR